MDLTCAICREIFEDPVLARDGYAYCRACIVRWVDQLMTWSSPRTNERIEGMAVLRGDIERCCLAREARLQELRHRIQNDDLGEALLCGASACYRSRPLLPPPECATLLARALTAEAYGWEAHPYLLLELAWRGKALGQLLPRHLMTICRYDRVAVQVPLLHMDVLAALAQEGARRLKSDDADDNALSAVLTIKEHLAWRGSFTDAIVVPTHRVPRDVMVGCYYRDWAQPSSEYIVYGKPAIPRLGQCAAKLLVSLQRQSGRGSAEALATTCVETVDAVPTRCHYSSETDLADGTEGQLRRARRELPFPDSRGGDTDDEDETLSAPKSLSIHQLQPTFLPYGFVYQAHCVDDAHQDELLRALSPVNEALLAYYQEERTPKRARTHASAFC